MTCTTCFVPPPDRVHLCQTEVAASVYRLVLSDLSLADTFGQVDLSWLPVIKSAPTVVRFYMGGNDTFLRGNQDPLS